jgi:hypothetical protein
VELLPLAVRVTEYQMMRRRCAQCGKRTRAELPAGVPRRPFGVRLTAVIALLSGRVRFSAYPKNGTRSAKAPRREEERDDESL